MADILFDNLEIRQFRAFDYLKIDHLGHVNLFIGKNNVGKSTVLEGLWLYANIGSPEIVQAILEGRDEPRELRHGQISEPTVWSMFYGHPAPEKVASSIQIGRINSPDSALSLSITWLSDRTEKGNYQEIDFPGDVEGNDVIPALNIKYGSMRRTIRLDDTFSDMIRRWKLQERSNRALETPCVFITQSGLNNHAARSLWEKIVLTDGEKDVVEAMRIIAPDVNDFALLPSDSQASSIRVRLQNEKNPIPLRTMGDGMNRLFGLGLALACSQNGILLIDEIENGIHWAVLPEVWKFILKVAKRLNVQVFATTHSNDCLRAFQQATKDDKKIEGVAIRIERKNGEFKSEIFDESRLSVIVKEEIEIR